MESKDTSALLRGAAEDAKRLIELQGQAIKLELAGYLERVAKTFFLALAVLAFAVPALVVAAMAASSSLAELTSWPLGLSQFTVAFALTLGACGCAWWACRLWHRS